MKLFLWPTLITLIAAALRTYGLNRLSLSSDEAFSQVIALAPPGLSWEAMIVDAVHPPLYYLILRAGTCLFGQTEFALRFPSMLCGILAIPLLFALVFRLTHRREVALFTALLLAVSPFHIWYSQDARMYALFVCLSLAAMYTFICALGYRTETGALPTYSQVLYWGSFVLTMGLVYSTHYFALFLPLIQFAFLVATLKQNYRALRIWVVAQAVAFAPLALWFAAIYGRGNTGFGLGWIPQPSLVDPLITLWNFSLSYSGVLWPWGIGAALMVGAAMFGIIGKHTCPRQAKILTGPWLVIPLLIALLLSFIVPIYVDRSLIFTLPAFLLLVACGVMELRVGVGRWLWAGTILAFTLLALIDIQTSPVFVKEDWHGLAGYLESSSRPSDVIVLRYLQDKFPFGYYYRGQSNVAVLTVNTETDRLDEVASGYSRLWLVYRIPNQSSHYLTSSLSYVLEGSEENAEVRSWIEAHAGKMIEETNRFADLHLLGFDLNDGRSR